MRNIRQLVRQIIEEQLFIEEDVAGKIRLINRIPERNMSDEEKQKVINLLEDVREMLGGERKMKRSEIKQIIREVIEETNNYDIDQATQFRQLSAEYKDIVNEFISVSRGMPSYERALLAKDPKFAPDRKAMKDIESKIKALGDSLDEDDPLSERINNWLWTVYHQQELFQFLLQGL